MHHHISRGHPIIDPGPQHHRTHHLPSTAVSNGPWENLSPATQLWQQISDRAYYLWLNKEPGTSVDRWNLAARIQKNGATYDRIFSKVARIVSTALPPRTLVNRQTKIPKECREQATQAAALAIHFADYHAAVVAETVGQFVDFFVALSLQPKW